MTLSKPAMNALAVVHLTGNFPKRIHIATWGRVNAASRYDHPVYRVRHEWLDDVLAHPMVLTANRFLAVGFVIIPGPQRCDYVNLARNNKGSGPATERVRVTAAGAAFLGAQFKRMTRSEVDKMTARAEEVNRG